MKGCPLKVTITSNTDVSKVVCSGEGLKWGIIGKEITSFIDTRKSGPGRSPFIIYKIRILNIPNVTGELTAHCVGPHKVGFCELFDHRDGTYTLNVKPQEYGRHTLNIKYGGMLTLL